MLPLTVMANRVEAPNQLKEKEIVEAIYKHIENKTEEIGQFPQGNPNPIPEPKKPVARLSVAQESNDLQTWLLKLRNCESGGDYTKNTGNGYYGAYQFSLATWSHWNKEYARADLAPASVQDAMIILNTQRTMGLVTQNPGCYQKLGLSNKPPQE